MIFKCRIVERDGDDEWTEVKAYHLDGAVREFAQERDGNSAGELFEDGQVHVVIVKDNDGVEHTFICSRELTPMYICEKMAGIAK